jgi:ribokinase
MDKYFPASSFMAVDTTGGADAFISALVSYLSEGYSLDQAIRIATYAAGFCISHLGVVSSLVDKLTLETYISKTEPELLHLHHDGQEEDQPPTAAE